MNTFYVTNFKPKSSKGKEFFFVISIVEIGLPCGVRATCTCRVVPGDLAQCLTVVIICAFAGGPGSVLVRLSFDYV